MARPLTDADEALLRHRGVARYVAGRLRRRFPACDFEDLEAACLVGVHRGLCSFDPSLGVPLHSHLCRCARREAAHEAARWSRGGLRGAPRDGRVRTGPLSDRAAGRLEATRREPVVWTGAEWGRAFACLGGLRAEAVRRRVLGGASPEEIARDLGYNSPQCVRSVVSQGLAAMRDSGDVRELWCDAGGDAGRGA